MREEKFTQGEWDYFISDNGDGFPIIFVGDIDIAEIYLPKGNSEEMFANANLIKTAPEMYYCICDALTDLEMSEGMRKYFETVLKKARGEE